MRVWTLQKFDIFSEPFRRECAYSYNDENSPPKLRHAYEQLWDRVGDQFIWCTLKEFKPKSPSWNDRQSWVIDVPENVLGKVLIRIVNANWWHTIIGGCGAPGQLWEHWKCVAKERFKTKQEQDDWIEEEKRKYLATRKDSDLWEMFWNCHPSEEGAEALVRLPVCRDWVVPPCP
jgi:hypothetical protein